MSVVLLKAVEGGHDGLCSQADLLHTFITRKKKEKRKKRKKNPTQGYPAPTPKLMQASCFRLTCVPSPAGELTMYNIFPAGGYAFDRKWL